MVALLALTLTLTVEPLFTPEGKIRYDVILNRHLAQGITPKTNANALLWQAIGPNAQSAATRQSYFDALGIPTPPKDATHFINWVDFLKEIQAPPDDPNIRLERFEQAIQQPWSVNDDHELADWIAANEIPLDIVTQAVKRPRYYNPLVVKPGEPLIGALLCSMSPIRNLGELLLMRAMLKLDQGQTARAWADILSCHRLASHVAEGGCLIECLVGYAIDRRASQAAICFLQSERLSVEQLQTYRKQFLALPRFQPIVDVLDHNERFITLDAIQHGEVEDVAGESVSQQIRQRMMKRDFQAVYVSMANHHFDRLVELATVDLNGDPPPDLKRISDQLENAIIKPPKPTLFMTYRMSAKQLSEYISQIVIRTLSPSVSKCLTRYAIAEQRRRLEQVAFDLAIHKRTTGSYPQQLAATPRDYFTGKPLLYKRTPLGYDLRSLGPDREPSDDDIAVTVPITTPRVE